MFQKWLLSVLCLLAASTGSMFAQPPQYYNNFNGSSNNNFPLNSSTNKVQWIYGPNLFKTNGTTGTAAPAGQITKIYIKLGTPVNASSSNLNFKISLGQSSGTASTFPNTTFVTGLTQVYFASSFSFTGATANQWYGITLQNNFNYNPAQSLVLEITTTSTSGGNLVSQVNGSGNERIWGTNAGTSGSAGAGLVNFGFDLTNPCNQPTGGNVSGITMTTANFSWNSVSGSQGYEYQITTSSTPPTTAGTFTSSTSYSATGLNNGTSYWFWVRNICTVGSAYSNWLAIPFTTVACPSIPLANVSVSNISTISADINWTAVSGSNGYEWALTTSAVPPSSGTTQSTTAYSATGLNPGTTYYFHVRNKCTSPSNSVWTTKSFSTLACPLAGTPTITSNTPGSVSFSWPGTTIPGVANYQWAITTSSATPTVWQTTSSLSASSSSLIPGTTYYLHVRSNCTSSQSPYTPLQFINPFPPCFAPTALSISNVNMHGAEITWNSSSNVVQGYQFAINTNPNPPASGTLTTDTFYTAVNLVGGQTYYVYVRTLCGQNVNNVVNYSNWTVDSFTTPTTCASNSSLNVSNVTSNSADIVWNNFPGVLGYEYIMNFSATPPAPGLSGAAVNFNHLAATNLLTGTTYYFHVRTLCDTVNNSPWATTSFTTSSVCTAPSTPVLTALTPTTASFAWSYVSGAQQYQYSVTSNSTPVSGNTYTSLNNVKVISLTPGTPYYFHVRAYCSPSDLSAWETTSFSTAQVSVESISSGKGYDVVVYPNPVKDMLNVEISGTMNGKGILMLYDLSGKLLQTVEMTSEKAILDLNPLAPGMYLLKYRDSESGGIMKVQKL